jgi:hypothetical protein
VRGVASFGRDGERGGDEVHSLGLVLLSAVPLDSSPFFECGPSRLKSQGFSTVLY